jgi:hypothetical protein
MLMQEKKDLSLAELIKGSYGIFARQEVNLEPLAKLMPALEDFFSQRIRYLLLEDGLRYDVAGRRFNSRSSVYKPFSNTWPKPIRFTGGLTWAKESFRALSHMRITLRCANT